jgi:hypothetical protein
LQHWPLPYPLALSAPSREKRAQIARISSVNIVGVIKPLTTAASGFWTSTAPPVAIAIGANRGAVIIVGCKHVGAQPPAAIRAGQCDEFDADRDVREWKRLSGFQVLKEEARIKCHDSAVEAGRLLDASPWCSAICLRRQPHRPTARPWAARFHTSTRVGTL